MQTLSDILKTLYFGNDSDIYKILNQSLYITEIENKTDILVLFNTGFRFITHKGTPVELYFDLLNQNIIRNSKSPLPIKPPHLIGFMGVILKYQYLERVLDFFCVNIDSQKIITSKSTDLFQGLGLVYYFDIDEVLTNGDFSTEIEILDGNNERKTHSSFQIINDNDCVNLPLRRTFNQIVYYNGSWFSEYRPHHFNRSIIYEEDKESYGNWTCDACGGDSNSGCMSSSGECYK
jgi:hypothetical protein